MAEKFAQALWYQVLISVVALIVFNILLSFAKLFIKLHRKIRLARKRRARRKKRAKQKRRANPRHSKAR